MSMGHTYKFFGFSISYAILNLPLSILCLPFMLLIPSSFSPSDTVTGKQCLQSCGWDETNSHRLLSLVEEKGRYGCSLKGRAPQSPWPRSQEESTNPCHDGFYWLNLHRNTGRIWKAHQSLSGSNDQIDNIQRTLRAYFESGSEDPRG